MRRTETPDPGWFDEVAGNRIHFLFKNIKEQRKIYFLFYIQIFNVLNFSRAVYT